ncbi:hypothetical protein DPMN_016528 [Dreissena polymorpha]|uniref:Uncharacterized protein n=1 Tax=Dreissena polymorpha TaxID=45954 RepID=A0A9D4S6I0_DREPO|nr:hypothetical protein DPMN_016528 [Dreissena polymorpha]
MSSRVFIFNMFSLFHIEQTAPPLAISIQTNVFTTFHDDRAKNVTYRVHVPRRIKTIFKHIGQNGPTPGGHVFQLIKTLFELVRDINKKVVWTKFHDDWAKNVTLRKDNPSPLGGHSVDDGRRTTYTGLSHKLTMSTKVLR